jgi:hypothetical protein
MGSCERDCEYDEKSHAWKRHRPFLERISPPDG